MTIITAMRIIMNFMASSFFFLIPYAEASYPMMSFLTFIFAMAMPGRGFPAYLSIILFLKMFF